MSEKGTEKQADVASAAGNRSNGTHANGNGSGVTAAKAATVSQPTTPPSVQPRATASSANRPAPPAARPAPAATGRPAAAKPPVVADEPEPSGFHFGRKFFELSGSFSISMIAHFVFLLALSLWVVPTVIQEQLEALTATEMRPQEELTKVLEQEVVAATEIDMTATATTNSVANLPVGHASSLSGGGEPTIDRTVADAVVGPQIALNDVSLWAVPGDDLKLDVPEGAAGDPSQVVDSYEEAMDRITHEILMNLLKGDVLVMWLFDQSNSMKDDQQEIRQRFDRVYEELGITEAAKGDALLTAIGSYGKDFVMHTQKPTSHISEIRGAIDAVPVDESGLENMCPAIGKMINEHRKFATGGRRRLMLICVTDESGEEADNLANLEAAIEEAKKARCPCYFLGREAVFGYPYAFMSYTEPTTQLGFWLQINRGPETPYPEQLQTNGFYRRYDAHPSGFGPYEQTRIARETSGIFFLLPSPEVNLVGRDNRKYELEAMRPYLPDLGPRAAYAEERDKSILRKTLWQVITDLNPYNPAVQPHIEMRHQFSINPQEFYTQVQQEHEKAKQYFLYLDKCEKALEGIKSRRDNEPSPRWRANYDLLYAQVLAYKVRLYEYGAYMELFAKNPKPIKNPFGLLKKTTHWELTTRAETITGDLTKSYIIRSTQMFEDIKKNHAGTPWAARAEWELARGFGVDLVEDYDDPRRAGLALKLPKY